MARGEVIYNTEKGNLEIPEYGRNVQNMIVYLKSLEDKALRQAYAEEIINLFAIMYPSNRHLADYKEKLWNHLYKIGKYDLDLDVPQGITIHRKDEINIEADMGYPQRQFNNRHYGVYIQDLIAKALKEENLELRESFKEVIASYMKLAYRTWNKEHFVSDDIILQDLKELSNGQLVFGDDYSIENLVSMKSKLGGTTTTSTWKRFPNKNNSNSMRRPNNNNPNNKRPPNKNFSKNRNVR